MILRCSQPHSLILICVNIAESVCAWQWLCIWPLLHVVWECTKGFPDFKLCRYSNLQVNCAVSAAQGLEEWILSVTGFEIRPGLGYTASWPCLLSVLVSGLDVPQSWPWLCSYLGTGCGAPWPAWTGLLPLWLRIQLHSDRCDLHRAGSQEKHILQAVRSFRNCGLILIFPYQRTLKNLHKLGIFRKTRICMSTKLQFRHAGV